MHIERLASIFNIHFTSLHSIVFHYSRSALGGNSHFFPYSGRRRQSRPRYSSPYGAHLGAAHQPPPPRVTPLMVVDTRCVSQRIASTSNRQFHQITPTTSPHLPSFGSPHNSSYSHLEHAVELACRRSGMFLEPQVLLMLRTSFPDESPIMLQAQEAHGAPIVLPPGPPANMSPEEAQTYPLPAEPIISDGALIDILLDLQEPPAAPPSFLRTHRPLFRTNCLSLP